MVLDKRDVITIILLMLLTSIQYMNNQGMYLELLCPCLPFFSIALHPLAQYHLLSM